MTWSHFLLWLAVAYLIYYFFVIAWDLLFASKVSANDDDGIVELTHDENIVPVRVEHLSQRVTEIIPQKKNEVKEESGPFYTDDEIVSNMQIEPFAETTSSGGLKLSELFNKHRPFASQITDSIMFNK